MMPVFFEPMIIELVGPKQENPMTLETDTRHKEFLALLKASRLEVPDYSADPIAQVRVGRVLAAASARVPIFPRRPRNGPQS